MATHIDIGRMGEDAAANYLESLGFSIIERNIRLGRYEIDILASESEKLHFIEVKTRRCGSLTSPLDAIDSRKSKSLFKAIEKYILEKSYEGEWQIDGVSVEYADNEIFVEYTPNIIIPFW